MTTQLATYRRGVDLAIVGVRRQRRSDDACSFLMGESSFKEIEVS